MNRIIVEAVERAAYVQAAEAYNDIARRRDPDAELARWRERQHLRAQEEAR